MSAELSTPSADRRFQASSHGAVATLRRRASEHPMTMFSILATAAFAAMLMTPTAGPAFASFSAPAIVADGATTTTKTARLPATTVDFACKGQAWGAESEDCLRVIAEQSGAPASRDVRMIASADASSDTAGVY